MSNVLTVLAASDNQSAWVMTLIAGAVVLLVVIVLLEGLRRAVVALNKSIWATWVNGKAVVKHSGTTYLLKNTRQSGEELVEELNHHG
ncbi:MAG: hypothetical protein M3401_19265 [Actinomycetota bacterium]|nr:hypothetical protein [Actinomycetota bacterium]